MAYTPYKGETSTYKLHFQSGIGVRGWDSSQPSATEDTRNSNILDTQIYGAIHAHGYNGQGIISNSRFTDYSIQNNSVIVRCSGIGAFIDHVYVENLSYASWSGVGYGDITYLYIQQFEGNRLNNFDSSRQKGNFTTYSNTTGGDVQNSLLVAVRYSGIGGFNTNPAGRINFSRLDDHIADYTDPHGSTWIQTSLISSGISDVGTTDVVLDGLVRSNAVTKDMNVSGIATFVGKGKFMNLVTEESMTLDRVDVCSGLDVYGTSLFRQDITLSSGVAIDGTSLSGIQVSITNHISQYTFPHRETALQVSGIPITGGTLFGDVYVESGIAIDGRNIRGQFTQLIDKSVLPDSVHYHDLAYPMGFSPNYENVVTSGIYPGELYSWNEENHNYYSWTGGEDNASSRIVFRTIVPRSINNLSGINIWNKIGSANEGSLTIRLKDTNNDYVTLAENTNIQNTSWTNSRVRYVSGTGTFEQGKYVTTEIDLTSLQSGIPVCCGEIVESYIVKRSS